MKTAIYSLLIIIGAISASAQTVTLATPDVPPSRTTLTIGDVHEHRADTSKDPNDIPSAFLIVRKLDGSGNTQAEFRCDVVGNAEMNLYLAALETPVTGEPTGSTLAARARRKNDRLLSFLQTNAATLSNPCTQFTAGTLVP